MTPKSAAASFDSAATFHRVVARHLHGKGSPAPGLGPAARAVSGLLPVVNRMPARVREPLRTWPARSEAIEPGRAGAVDTGEIAEWACARYPRGRYPAVLIGSSSGALAHLAALAGIPWLPQTFLVPVRHDRIDPDDPRRAVTALAAARRAFTEANPGVALHHVHDADHDRLTIHRTGHFRFKYQRLPAAYRRFLRDRLAPGGAVVVADCTERWPTTTLGPREFFQHGAVGDATPEEYARGGPRVAAFLAEQGATRHAWDAPPADGDSPEAEWGFDPALLPGLAELCRAEGWRLDRLTFPRADALSGPVAELYRSWFAEEGVAANRLLVGSYSVIDVHVPLTHGLVPYWSRFGTCAARDTLLRYLSAAEPYDDVHLGLFSHGTSSIGRARIADWDAVLEHARRRGTYCGVDPFAYPRDFASNGRFHRAAAALAAAPVRAGTPPWDWVRDRLRHGHPAVRYGSAG